MTTGLPEHYRSWLFFYMGRHHAQALKPSVNLRGAAYGHLIGQAERVQLEPRSFSDFMSRDSEYRRSTQQSQQLAEKKKKHHFLFF